MSKTLKHIYTKPNESIAISFWGDEILLLINTYFDAGKITQKPVKTIDGLKETYTTVFKLLIVTINTRINIQSSTIILTKWSTNWFIPLTWCYSPIT